MSSIMNSQICSKFSYDPVRVVSSVGSERLVYTQKAAGSNPAPPTIRLALDKLELAHGKPTSAMITSLWF